MNPSDAEAHPEPAWSGWLASIHIGPAKAAPTQAVESIRALAGRGLEGDRYCSGPGSNRKHDEATEVTLIEWEALEALRRDHQIDLAPGACRRNLVTRNVPLNHLVGRRFQVGPVALQGIRLCEPCGHLESLTRKGVMRALVHRGGLRARILTDGRIRVGDGIAPLPGPERPPVGKGGSI